jgi:hypothetical protein
VSHKESTLDSGCILTERLEELDTKEQCVVGWKRRYNMKNEENKGSSGT